MSRTDSRWACTARGSGNLQRDTDQIVSAFAQSNPQLRRQEGYSRETIGGRNGVRTTLTNQSDITGQPEVISLATTQLNDGRVLFLVGVAPQRDAGLTTTCSGACGSLSNSATGSQSPTSNSQFPKLFFGSW